MLQWHALYVSLCTCGKVFSNVDEMAFWNLVLTNQQSVRGFDGVENETLILVLFIHL